MPAYLIKYIGQHLIHGRIYSCRVICRNISQIAKIYLLIEDWNRENILRIFRLRLQISHIRGAWLQKSYSTSRVAVCVICWQSNGTPSPPRDKGYPNINVCPQNECYRMERLTWQNRTSKVNHVVKGLGHSPITGVTATKWWPTASRSRDLVTSESSGEAGTDCFRELELILRHEDSSGAEVLPDVEKGKPSIT